MVYLDDIVITGDDPESIKDLKRHLFNHFNTKDLGRLRCFLWIEVAQLQEDIAISQKICSRCLGRDMDVLSKTG